MDFINISKEELAEYIEKIYKMPVLQTIVSKSETLSLNKKVIFVYYGEFLTQYATATGDLSEEGILSVAKAFEENILLLKNNARVNNVYVSPKETLFDASVMPNIVKHYANKFNFEKKLSLTNLEQIADAIKNQTLNNHFLTHSFNGALLDIVKTTGLDINKELFKDEFQTLSTLSQTPYKTGVLCFCELSYASFGYLHKSPEKMWMTLLGDGSIKQEEKETDNHFAKRLLTNLIKKNIPSNDKEKAKKVFEAGNKIIDFYTKTSMCCMAIKKEERQNLKITQIDGIFANALDIAIYKIPFAERRNIPKEALDNLKTILRDKDQTGKIQKIQSCLDEFVKENYLSEECVSKVKKDAFYNIAQVYCLANYKTAYADGYEIKSGKLSINEFAIASVNDFSREAELNNNNGFSE